MSLQTTKSFKLVSLNNMNSVNTSKSKSSLKGIFKIKNH